MQNRDESIRNFCQEILAYLTNARQNFPEIPEKSATKASQEMLMLIKSTQLKVCKEIQKLIDHPNQEEKLLNLYVIDHTLYQLYLQMNHADTLLAENLYLTLKQTLNHRLEKIEKIQRDAKEKFLRSVTWNNRIQILCYIIAIVCAFAGFAYPKDVILYFSLTLICLIQIFLLSNVWLYGARQKRDAIINANNPSIIKNALEFLNVANLTTLLESPSFAPEYLERFLKMLTNLALSHNWIPHNTIDIEDVIENGTIALKDAYSTLPATFNPVFIREWRKKFEEIQAGLHLLFGESLDHFNQKTKSHSLFYLKQYSTLQSSELGKNLHQFLKETEFILMK